jgi:hypothetical protein
MRCVLFRVLSLIAVPLPPGEPQSQLKLIIIIILNIYIIYYISVTLTTWHLLSAQVGNTSPRSGGRSVGIVRSLTQTMEFFYIILYILLLLSSLQ